MLFTLSFFFAANWKIKYALMFSIINIVLNIITNFICKYQVRMFRYLFKVLAYLKLCSHSFSGDKIWTDGNHCLWLIYLQWISVLASGRVCLLLVLSQIWHYWWLLRFRTNSETYCLVVCQSCMPGVSAQLKDSYLWCLLDRASLW